jgi:hypothetical protein
MKLASDLLVYQLLTQCLPGFHHQGETLGPPFLDARLHPMWANGIDDQGPSLHLGAQGAEPPQGIYKADLLYAEVLKCR